MHVYTVLYFAQRYPAEWANLWLKLSSQIAHKAVKGILSPEEGKEVDREEPPAHQPLNFEATSVKGEGQLFFKFRQISYSLEAALVFRVATPTANGSNIFKGVVPIKVNCNTVRCGSIMMTEGEIQCV